jgi:FlaA1/EpsC-like NDP-sugar epimerase
MEVASLANNKPLQDKRILVTGGTGSLGKVLIKRLLSGELGYPEKVIVFSRDEAKQHSMRLNYQQKTSATDEVIYCDFEKVLEFRIGDVRDFHSLASILCRVDVVFNAAALKQVPTCEYFPYEAVKTNITGAENIVRAISQNTLPVETVVGISTDKACKPVNVMGMTKAIQERIFLSANLACLETRFVGVRYGNVLASRGSVIPLFHDQIKRGGPVTITTPEMTRFLMSLDQAVDTIFAALLDAHKGETYIPQVPSAQVTDVIDALIDKRQIKIETIGVRPGEKIHEILVSEEEAHRTVNRNNYYIILPLLPELRTPLNANLPLGKEYSSADSVINRDQVHELLKKHKLLIKDNPDFHEGV